ncbi:MAG: GTPase domain-containing protein, partial [Desulfobacterales bacterium]
MAFINRKTGEIQLKIVYAGPARSGKSASLAWIHRRFARSFSSRLVRVRAGEGQTVLFDFAALGLPPVSGFRLHVRLYTLPGDERFESTAKLALRGVDGIVFVADASAMRKTNILALKRIEAALTAAGRSLEKLPLVFQFNKYDLLSSGALLLPPATLAADLNRAFRRPCWVTSAATGKNLLPPFCKIITLAAAALEGQARRRMPDLPLRGFAAAVAESLAERFSFIAPR